MENFHPKWVTKELLEQILYEGEGAVIDRPTVLEFKLEAATKKGQNYASDMYRALVQFRNRQDSPALEISIILKIMPASEVCERVMIKNNIYPREISVYSEIMPRINKLLRSIGDDTKLAPRCLYTSAEPKLFLAFEDIKRLDFTMIDGTQGLNLQQTQLVMAKLAKLHACSAVIHEKEPNLMDMYLEGCISNNPERQEILKLHTLFTRALFNIVKKWSHAEEEWIGIADKLEKLEHTIVAKGVQVYTRDDDEFNSFVHSDLWCNNLMFRNDNSSEAADVLLLDYQLSCWGSPAIDLNFFLYGSVQGSVRRQWKMHLIKEYHHILSSTLSRLNYSGRIPSLQDLHIALIKKGSHCVIAAISLLPLSMMEKSDNAEMDVFLQETEVGDNFRNGLCNNPRYLKLIKMLLLEFDLMGYLD